MSKQPRPSIIGDLNLEDVAPKAAKSAKVEKVVENKPSKGEAEMFRTSIVMDRKLHDVLREIAFVERTTVTALVMEGLDSVLKSRRHPSAAEITSKA